MVMEVEHPVEGKVRQLGNPIKSSQFPFEIRAPSPGWGEHTTDVLKTIGFSEEEIEHFKVVKAI
jgi:crotonobetainyl-CoA:carnitine CoA-transferase CaiB-like acyl-CoA transferase